jgi:SAM-dependent methyltransferase
MNTVTLPHPAERTADWFATWFDSAYYRALYASRDDAEAAAFVDALVSRLQPPPGSTALDLGCGTGRHARRLAAHGFDVTGLDLSVESLRIARRSGPASLQFVHGDMRQPFGYEQFETVYNLFTSFGYFEDPADNLTVLGNIRQALMPGGCLVLDYLNVRYAEAHLTQAEVVDRGAVTYQITRALQDGFIVKRIHGDVGGRRHAVVDQIERVARLTRVDLEWMVWLTGLRVEAVFGDYTLAPFEESDPRA